MTTTKNTATHVDLWGEKWTWKQVDYAISEARRIIASGDERLAMMGRESLKNLAEGSPRVAARIEETS